MIGVVYYKLFELNFEFPIQYACTDSKSIKRNWLASLSLTLGLLLSQILSKTANNAVMETVDPEITATCKDLGAIKKVFQLALLCTKRQPLDRPTMHEVTRVLGSLVPSITPPKQPALSPTAPLPSTKVSCYMDEYANLKTPHMVNCPSMSTSDAQLFLKFGEVISQNSVWITC